MGVPHLTRHLSPYATQESLQGRSAVIDGPSFAYHIYGTCLGSKPWARNIFEAAPSYKELQDAAIAWLNILKSNGVDIQLICFDGFLPSSKLDVRFERLFSQTRSLAAYSSANPTLCLFHTLSKPSTLLSKDSAVGSKATGFYPNAFLVPAVLEALIESSDYAKITVVAPGEADPYCASYLKLHGGIVLTSDSDLLLHDLGEHGAVTYFRDIEQSGNDEAGSLKAQIYYPQTIARRLSIYDSQYRGFHALAFEMVVDSHATFGKLLAQAKVLKAAKENVESYEKFRANYVSLESLDLQIDDVKRSRLLQVLQKLDPRTSEFVLRIPYFAAIAGVSSVDTSGPSKLCTPRVFLPFLTDSPKRTNAWEVSSNIRQLAYGMINLVLPEDEIISKVFEYRRQTDYSSGREIQLPAKDVLLRECTALSDLFYRTRGTLQDKEHLMKEPMVWSAIAVHQDAQWAHNHAKECCSQLAVADLERSNAKLTSALTITWPILHFYAQAQGSFYSLRMLKQILELIAVVWHATRSPSELKDYEPIRLLEGQLESLPALRDLTNLQHIASLIQYVEPLQTAMPPDVETKKPSRKRKPKQKRSQPSRGPSQNQFQALSEK